MPPAPASPCAQKPAATKKPATSVSPRQNSLSGVNASGPLINLVTLISSIAGTRRLEFSVISSKRSQSSSSRRPLKSGGMRVEPARAVGHEGRLAVALVAAHDEAAAVLAEVDEEVGVAQRGEVARPARGSRNGCVTRYWWDIGISGTRTPASRAISAAYMPPASTTTSASIVAAVGAHAAHPAVAHVDPGHPGRR